jgi:hypothetical protein
LEAGFVAGLFSFSSTAFLRSGSCGFGGVASIRFSTSSRRLSSSSELDVDDMPQPFNKIVPDPHIVLDETHWADKPEINSLVAAIFATWAKIETELGCMLVRILGADAAPTLAVYEKLNTQSLKRVALEAAARAALAEDDFERFQAMSSVLDTVEATRNKLAHWVWCYCKQKPDVLGLADPKMIQETRKRSISYFKQTASDSSLDMQKAYELAQYDTSRVLAFSADDLRRALADTRSAYETLFYFEISIDPTFKSSVIRLIVDQDADEIRAELFRRLNQSRLFREALARVRNAKGPKSSPPTQGEPPQPKPQAS